MTGLPSGTVAFLFTDIEGSTRLLDVLRARYADVLADQRKILRASFANWNGHEVDTQGDAFFVAFTRTGDALRCAVEAQRALAAWEWPSGVEVRVRMGIHCGEPLVAATGYVGMDVHRAARIAAAGHGGQILLSSTARDLVNDDLPPHVELRDLGSHPLKDLREEVHLYQVAGEGLQSDFPPLMTLAAKEPPPTPGEAPYRGLQSFEADDADLFFGREEAVAQLVSQVTRSRFVALVGASGSGKSSVLRAGLLPALGSEDQAWRTHLLTPTAHPLEALAEAVSGEGSAAEVAALADDLRADPRSLALFLRRSAGRRKAARASRVLLAVDQLEEVFTLCRDESERTAFLDALANASGLDEGPATSPPPADRVTVVVAIRADFYAFLSPFARIRDAAAGSQLYLGAMSPEELRRAIEEPARQRGWDFVPGLVDLLLHEVGDEPGALPLLSHALLETWRRRRGTTMTLRSFSESGGVRGAIARTADRVYEQLPEDERQIARDIFLRLTELGEGTQDTRRRVRTEELLGGDANATARIREVARILADARLITAGADRVEVAHEALIREWPMLREWLHTDRENLRVHRRATDAAREWEVAGFDEAMLYRGTRLEQLRDLVAASSGVLNELEQRFLDASLDLATREEAEQEAAKRRELEAAEALAAAESQRAAESALSAARLRRRAIFLGGALAVAAVLAAVAVIFARQANGNAHEAQTNLATADSRRLGAAADAILLRGGDPDLATLLALNGLHEQVTTQADTALQRAVRAPRELAIPDAKILDIAATPDGKTLITLDGRDVHFWDTTSGKQIDAWTITNAATGSGPGGHLLLSRDGTLLLVSSPAGSAALYRLHPAPERIDAGCTYLSDPNATARALAPDGASFLVAEAASADGSAFVVDRISVDGCQLQDPVLSVGSDRPDEMVISPDGAVFVTLHGTTSPVTTTIRVWSTRTLGAVSPPETLQGGLCGCSVAFSRDDKRMVVGGTGGPVNVLDVRTGNSVQELGVDLAATEGVQFSGDDSALLVARSDGWVRLWDLATASVSFLHRDPGTLLRGLLSADGTSVFTVSGDLTSGDLTIRKWSIGAATEGFSFQAGAGQVAALAYSPDGASLAAAASNQLEVVDANTPAQPVKMRVSSPGIDRMAFGPSGQLLTASASGSIVWDARSGVPQPVSNGANVTVSGLEASFSADGSVALTSSEYEDVIWLWNTTTNPWTRIDASLLANVATLSRDGKLVAGWSGTEGVYWVYDMRTGKTVTIPSAQQFPPPDLTLTPDGSKLIAAPNDNLVRVWDTQTLKPLLEMKGPTSRITQVAVTPDGTDVLAASDDGNVYMWDLASGQLVRIFAGHEDLAVTSMAVSPNGKSLAIGSEDGTVIITPLHVSDLEAQACNSLSRGLTDQERATYDIASTAAPACPAP